MSDEVFDKNEEGEEVGSVQVRISKRQVHNAVRNIVVNELKVDPNEIRKEVVARTEEVVRKEVLDYIGKNGWTQLNLRSRVETAIDRVLSDVKGMIKDVVRELVRETIQQEVEGAVEVLVREGVEIRLGWNRKTKVKIAMEKKKEDS